MTEPIRLTVTGLKTWREQRLADQHGRCALCQLPCKESEAVADHNHATGYLRGVLHRGCNSMLGHIENNAKRYALRSVPAFLNGAAGYLQRHVTPQSALQYPTHRTEDEKRLLRNKRARKARAQKKESA